MNNQVSTKTFELTDEQFQKLMQLCRLYRREADKCMDAKSYLAGCVMMGAALESDLVAMCHCYSDEIPIELIPKLKNGQPKPLLDWSLFQLLHIARELNWLPARLELNAEWDRKNAQIGDYAVVLKDMRNLVHASRYISDFTKSRMTKRRAENAFEILDVASGYLQARLHASLREAIKEEERETAFQNG